MADCFRKKRMLTASTTFLPLRPIYLTAKNASGNQPQEASGPAGSIRRSRERARSRARRLARNQPRVTDSSGVTGDVVGETRHVPLLVEVAMLQGEVDVPGGRGNPEVDVQGTAHRGARAAGRYASEAAAPHVDRAHAAEWKERVFRPACRERGVSPRT